LTLTLQTGENFFEKKFSPDPFQKTLKLRAEIAENNKNTDRQSETIVGL